MQPRLAFFWCPRFFFFIYSITFPQLIFPLCQFFRSKGIYPKYIRGILHTTKKLLTTRELKIFEESRDPACIDLADYQALTESFSSCHCCTVVNNLESVFKRTAKNEKSKAIDLQSLTTVTSPIWGSIFIEMETAHSKFPWPLIHCSSEVIILSTADKQGEVVHSVIRNLGHADTLQPLQHDGYHAVVKCKS